MAKGFHKLLSLESLSAQHTGRNAKQFAPIEWVEGARNSIAGSSEPQHPQVSTDTHRNTG